MTVMWSTSASTFNGPVLFVLGFYPKSWKYNKTTNINRYVSFTHQKIHCNILEEDHQAKCYILGEANADNFSFWESDVHTKRWWIKRYCCYFIFIFIYNIPHAVSMCPSALRQLLQCPWGSRGLLIQPVISLLSGLLIQVCSVGVECWLKQRIWLFHSSNVLSL